MLSLISTRLTIIEVQLKMKISTNDSIIIIYIGFLRVRRREAFQLVLFFHSVFYYIIKIRKKVWNETKSSSPFSIKSRQNFFFRIDHSRPSVLPNIIFCFELFQRKIFAIKKKKKTRDLDFSKHVTCVLQFLSSHELLIGRYVLSTFQVRLIHRIIRIFKFIFSITISIEHFLFFFFFFLSKYINYIRRSTIYKRIYSAMDNVPQEKNKTDSKFFSSSRTPCDLSRSK